MNLTFPSPISKVSPVEMAAMTEEGAENDLLDYEEEETETTTEVRRPI